LKTKIHVVADVHDQPLHFILTAGEAHDIVAAPQLLSKLSGRGIIDDKAYDSNALRDLIANTGAEAVIPSRASRKVIFPHDRVTYRLRTRIERFSNTLGR
jgi:transposase